MALEQELATYRAHLTELASAHEGEFVLIRGDQILGTFAGYEQAQAFLDRLKASRTEAEG